MIHVYFIIKQQFINKSVDAQWIQDLWAACSYVLSLLKHLRTTTIKEPSTFFFCCFVLAFFLLLFNPRKDIKTTDDWQWCIVSLSAVHVYMNEQSIIFLFTFYEAHYLLMKPIEWLWQSWILLCMRQMKERKITKSWYTSKLIRIITKQIESPFKHFQYCAVKVLLGGFYSGFVKILHHSWLSFCFLLHLLTIFCIPFYLFLILKVAALNIILFTYKASMTTCNNARKCFFLSGNSVLKFKLSVNFN